MKRFPVRFLLWLKAEAIVPKEHTAVMLMLCVATPADPITARTKMAFMKMESTALVTICSTSWFNQSRAFI